jgi:hypothetical protein
LADPVSAALIPGVVVGGAAVLAPGLLPKPRRRLQPMLRSSLSPRTGSRIALADRPEGRALIAAPGRSPIKQAIAND